MLTNVDALAIAEPLPGFERVVVLPQTELFGVGEFAA
jgi:hypothetical protein